MDRPRTGRTEGLATELLVELSLLAPAVVVAPGHGLTTSDLAGLTGLGLAVWRGYRARRDRRD